MCQREGPRPFKSKNEAEKGRFVNQRNDGPTSFKGKDLKEKSKSIGLKNLIDNEALLQAKNGAEETLSVLLSVFLLTAMPSESDFVLLFPSFSLARL